MVPRANIPLPDYLVQLQGDFLSFRLPPARSVPGKLDLSLSRLFRHPQDAFCQKSHFFKTLNLAGKRRSLSFELLPRFADGNPQLHSKLAASKSAFQRGTSPFFQLRAATQPPVG